MPDDSKTTVDMDNLDEFEVAFFGKEKEPIEAAPAEEDEVQSEEVEENEDDTLETDEDKDASEESEDDDLEEEEEEAPPPKKDKKSFRNRIDELTADKYELRRQLESLQSELHQFKTRSTEVEKPAEVPIRETLSSDAPNPDAKDDKGEPLYPLGEFDPLFIRDLTKFTIKVETQAAREQAMKEQAAAAKEVEVQQLSEQWNEKLAAAEEEIPDIRDDIRDLVTVFQGVDVGYGEYLATILMGLDNGPKVMHYLSQNIGEAQKIVASGPAAATLAIGQIDARLATPKEDKRNKRVSEAPEPPANRTRGQGGKFAVASDTDDLDAFEREFFKKPARPF